MDSFIPWHTLNWEKIALLRQQNRLPHAMLLVGNSGLAKNTFAKQLAYSYLCSEVTADGRSCGHCHNCHLLEAGTHPDFVEIEPGESGQIKIDDIRDYVGREGLMPQISERKVLLINKIERLNNAAFNAFLKTLEEPVASSRIILTSNRVGQLPATIRSRCQILNFPPPDAKQIEVWLDQQIDAQSIPALIQASNANPSLALALSEEKNWLLYQQQLEQFCKLMQRQMSALDIAKDWAKLDVKIQAEKLVFWLLSIGRFVSTGSEQHILQFKHLKPALSQINLIQLNYLINDLVNIPATTHLNEQLLWEDIFLRLGRLVLNRS